MKSLQERIAWYETNFPDMAEHGLVRFFDSDLINDDEKRKGTNSAHTNTRSEENLERKKQGLPYVTDIYLSAKDIITETLSKYFNFIKKPEYSRDVHDDHVFFHELAHVIHKNQGDFYDDYELYFEDNVNIVFLDSKPEEKITTFNLYKECVADAFATLMTIREHGLNKGIGFANIISDFRLINIGHMARHLTTLTIDDCVQETLGQGSIFSYDDATQNLEHLKEMTPEEIFKISKEIAQRNPLLVELKENKKSLKVKSQEINEDLLTEKKPLKDIQSISPRLKERFHQAVHRRISMRQALGDNSTHEEKIYDGPWADANAKFIHSLATKNRDRKLSQEDAHERNYPPQSFFQRLARMNGRKAREQKPQTP